MSAPDLDGWKKLIEEARGYQREYEDCDWLLLIGHLAAALDSAVAHIGRLEGQRDEAMESARESIARCDAAKQGALASVIAEKALRDIVRVLSRTADGTQSVITDGLKAKALEADEREMRLPRWAQDKLAAMRVIVSRSMYERGTEDGTQ